MDIVLVGSAIAKEAVVNAAALLELVARYIGIADEALSYNSFVVDPL